MAMRGKQPGGLLTQQKMLRAAVAIFLEKGYEHTTTAEIAVAAGMRPSSFFRAYTSKEAILLELVQRDVQRPVRTGPDLERPPGPRGAVRHRNGPPAAHRRAVRTPEGSVCAGLLSALHQQLYPPQHDKAADGDLQRLSAPGAGEGLLRDGDRPPAA